MPLSASGHRKRLLFKSQKRDRADVLLISPAGWGGTALYLAAHGWQVTAVDYSAVALDILSERAAEGLPVHIVLADLEKDEYAIAPNAWDLIVDCCYLQRSLFPAIKAGVRQGGAVCRCISDERNQSSVSDEAGRRKGTVRGIGSYCTTRKTSGRRSSRRNLEMAAEQRTGAPPAVQPPDKS